MYFEIWLGQPMLQQTIVRSNRWMIHSSYLLSRILLLSKRASSDLLFLIGVNTCLQILVSFSIPVETHRTHICFLSSKVAQKNTRKHFLSKCNGTFREKYEIFCIWRLYCITKWWTRKQVRQNWWWNYLSWILIRCSIKLARACISTIRLLHLSWRCVYRLIWKYSVRVFDRMCPQP